jgi:hypothetical protein
MGVKLGLPPPVDNHSFRVLEYRGYCWFINRTGINIRYTYPVVGSVKTQTAVLTTNRYKILLMAAGGVKVFSRKTCCTVLLIQVANSRVHNQESIRYCCISRYQIK